MAKILRAVAVIVRQLYTKKCSILVHTKWEPNHQQVRHLNVHEHVSYTLFKDYGIPVPKFGVAKTKEEVKQVAESIGTKKLVVKAQVLAGGRGKGTFKNGFKGGVKVVESVDEAVDVAGNMLGNILVTMQTGPKGLICNKVMIAEARSPKKECYIALMMDRSSNGPIIIASSEGGVSIEEVAAINPGAVITLRIDYIKGVQKEDAERVAKKIGLENRKDEVIKLLTNMYKLFVQKDVLLIELNPFAQDDKGNFFALDAKMNFDDNAAFRQKEIFAQRDITQEDPKEVHAAKFNLNYIVLDGNIGFIVNGAGLAMATLDIISQHGGSLANFLDVGGAANKDTVKEAFKIITSDPRVKVILVNIFGGIIRCDVIAEGIVAAAKELDMKHQIVCRLCGTNAEIGKSIINKSGLKLIPVQDLDEASKTLVKIAAEK